MTFPTYDNELQPFPGELAEAFRSVRGSVADALSPEDYAVWADSGLDIARRAGRSWEAAREYFKASPVMVRALPFSYFKQWVHWGGVISEESPVVGEAYFRAGPEVAESLKPWDMTEWAQLGKELFSGARRSGVLSSRFFEASGDLLRVLSFSELKHLVVLVETIAEKSPDEAISFLTHARETIPVLNEDLRACLSLIAILVKEDWRQARGCLEIVPAVLAHVDPVERARFLALAGRLAESTEADTPTFLKEGARAFSQIDAFLHVHVLDLADALSKIEPTVVADFIRGVPHVLKHVSVKQLESWYQEGIAIMEDNPEGGSAFFRSESSKSEEVLERLSMGVELGRIKEVLRLYCRALSDSDVEISTPAEEQQQGKGWVGLEKMMEKGATVYLPSVSERFTNKEDNFGWYKVVATHQVAHLEFESFHFSFDTPAAIFSDMRQDLVAQAGGILHDDTEDGDGPGGVPVGTDIQRFFALFDDGVLARDIFTAVEDYRLDYRVKGEYPGIRRAYATVQQQSLRERPPVEEMHAREVMVELLIRLSLQNEQELLVPEQYSEWAKALSDVVRPLSRPQALVEDSTEATIRLYQLISQIPNQDLSEQGWEDGVLQDQAGGQEESTSQEDWEEYMKRLMESQPVPQDGEDSPYQSPPSVDYRGEFKPELMQIISMLRDTGQERDASGQTMSKEDMEKLLAEANELNLKADRGDLKKDGMFLSEMAKNPDAKGTPQGAMPQVKFPYDAVFDEEEQGGPLEVKEPQSFLYDEWDYRISDYRPRWCLLREKAMTEGDSNYFNATLDSYSLLASQIRRQFELLVPQGFRKMKRQQDGDELELDSVIEAMVDKRSGVSPSDQVYNRRNKVQRDVAAVFLLDMSASTAEAIDETRRQADEWDAPDDPLEYMFWLRSRRGEGVRRSYKRIIDLEKESLVLLIHALETIGDSYGIYGFSGYGRENVDFFVIKDIGENLTDRVKRRIDKVAPLQATRMGPAIRHAIAKLEKQEARTKFFFLISDGRPQDRGYSREGVEKEYAIHDTREALIEAQEKGITPFCLTVDKEGHDYLRAMCQDMGYEVLADINALPKRLPTLYRNLTL